MSTAENMVFAHSQQDDCATVEALVKALVGDGFTSCVVGRSKDAPTALVATYDWPEQDDREALVDLVVIPLGGPAVAARLPRGQWDTAWWTWIGEPLAAIWALLNLPHPDHSDAAPHQILEAPSTLRLAQQSPMVIHTNVPDPGKARNRAMRLSRERHHEEMSATFVSGFFEAIDHHRTAVGLAKLFTEDGVLVMPGCPEFVGQTAIALATDSMFDNLADVKHLIRRMWNHEEDSTAVVEGVVTFTRLDGSKLAERFTVVVDYVDDDDEGLKVARWSVYGDYHKLAEPDTPNPQDCKAINLTAGC